MKPKRQETGNANVEALFECLVDKTSLGFQHQKGQSELSVVNVNDPPEGGIHLAAKPRWGGVVRVKQSAGKLAVVGSNKANAKKPW